MDENTDLLDENIPKLNAQFYERRPWEVLRYRVLHLAALAGDSDAFATVLRNGVSLGDVRFEFTPTDEDGDISAEGQIGYVATETEVLLQQACETLVRLWFAHRPDDDARFVPACPWLVLAGDRDFKRFRSRCGALARANADDLVLPVARVFVNTGPFEDEQLETARKLARFLKLAARVCLDPHAYNAAKHGLAVRGGRSKFTLDVEEMRVFDVDGFDLETLEVAHHRGRRRWAVTTKWISVERSLVVSWLITNLVQSMWSVARYRYVTRTGTVRVFDPGESETLLEYGEIVLAQQRHFLTYVDDIID